MPIDSAIEKEQKQDTNLRYQPNKEERKRRRWVYDRYVEMSGDSQRREAERDWELADKAYRLWTPTKEEGDWRANFTLPDAFSAIQADMQEKIERLSRPFLRGVEDSDVGKADFGNALLTYNMDRTNYDYQFFLAKLAAAIRGTAFLWTYWRHDEREIEDASGLDEDGQLTYKKKTIVDFDDDYTEWVENEYIQVDPGARSDEEMRDCFRREILDIDSFKLKYGKRKDFRNVDKVIPGQELENVSFFKMPRDLSDDEVEVLHYYNRELDRYDVLANNILVRLGPLPFKHKELPLATLYHYRVPGRFWGLGIPKVIHNLTEERRSIRMLNLDRQKMQTNKMFFVDDRVDIDEEEAITRPHGIIEVNTGGQNIGNVILPMEYGDVPASYFRTEEILLEDIRRAHGIDDRIQGVQTGGTATEAAILKESSLKRVNMIAKLAEIDTVKRIGRLKWSNIRFFYPLPKIETITEDNKDREKKTYRKITIEGKQVQVVEDKQGNKSIKVNEIEGSTTFTLDKEHAYFMEGDFDTGVDAEAYNALSKPIQQAKTIELLTLLSTVPEWRAKIDPDKGLRRTFAIFQENPKNWLKGEAYSPELMREMADMENELMARGTMLAPTKDASAEHTLVHVNFTETVRYQQLDENTRAIIDQHILGEHDQNPEVGSAADLLAGAEGGSLEGGPMGIPAPGAIPEMQNTDMTPSTVTGEEPNNTGEDQDIAL